MSMQILPKPSHLRPIAYLRLPPRRLHLHWLQLVYVYESIRVYSYARALFPLSYTDISAAWAVVGSDPNRAARTVKRMQTGSEQKVQAEQAARKAQEQQRKQCYRQACCSKPECNFHHYDKEQAHRQLVRKNGWHKLAKTSACEHGRACRKGAACSYWHEDDQYAVCRECGFVVSALPHAACQPR